jgi:hypothetical protein
LKMDKKLSNNLNQMKNDTKDNERPELL